jgi:hypothetical protein
MFNGLEVATYGAILANNLTANWNGQAKSMDMGSGVYFDNCINIGDPMHVCHGSVPKPITLTGFSTFLGNWINGLTFHGSGLVTVNHVNADGNGFDDGLTGGVAHPGDGISGWSESISISCSSMTGNGNSVSSGYGFHLDAVTAITLKGVFEFGNATEPAFTNIPPTVIPSCP